MKKLIYDTRQLPLTLTAEEAARLMRVNIDYVRRLLRKGELKGKKIGKGWLIPKENVLSHMGITEHIA